VVKDVIGLHKKYVLDCPILIKLEFSRPDFEKYSITKFNENDRSGSRVVPCGRTDGQS
jgi:hypothetical protein